MLALLPQILFLGAFSATLIRITISIILAISAWRQVSRADMAVRAFAIIEIVVAAALFVGAWTQVIALIGIALIALSLLLPQFRSWPRSTLVLALVMTLTLVVTGPGALAFDLPL